MSYKPTLFPNEKADLDMIKYPILASKKLDGIRCIFFPFGKMLSRSLKEIPNAQLQKKFENIKKFCQDNNMILDGEIYGEGLSFQTITHWVMSDNLEHEEMPDLKFYCFDALKDMNASMPFEERIKLIPNIDGLVKMKQTLVKSKEEVEAMFDNVLESGYEGLILKNPKSVYKYGRISINSGDGYKVKPFITIDGEIVGVEERFLNLNESQTNELGHSFKRKTVDNRVGTGIASCFVVLYNGQEQRVVITGTEDFRREIWENQKNYIGKFCEYKAMTIGAKDLLRHPVFLRMRADKQ